MIAILLAMNTTQLTHGSVTYWPGGHDHTPGAQEYASVVGGSWERLQVAVLDRHHVGPKLPQAGQCPCSGTSVCVCASDCDICMGC